MEITDRDDLGANLIAPTLASNGKQTWSYALVDHVRPGDVVFHWWTGKGQIPSLMGYSTAVGDPFESTLTWAAHGTYSVGQRTTPAFEVPLADLTPLAVPLTLDDVRLHEPQLRDIRNQLDAEIDGATYFPFAFSDKRPVRTAQGYLVKMPVAVVRELTGLDVAVKPPARTGATGTRGSGRQQDVEVRKAIERHAVDWALQYFEAAGFAVEDVGSTESFDVLALGDEDQELHIEVKGSSGEAFAIELTEGEVGHRIDGTERVLVVVDRIDWERTTDKVTTSGGRPRVWRNWEIAPDHLVPTRYRYTVLAAHGEVDLS